MLLNLNVTNFAIIDNINIDFKNNMTVLTGETGAGKSLIIDCIGLLFGDRASSEMVRSGENKSRIDGVFQSNDNINNYLESIGVDYSDDLIITREIYANGKSICRVNSQTITLASLVELSKYLGDIHTQLDTHRLINPKNYLSFLETDKSLVLLNEYKGILKEYKAALKKYNDLVNKHDEDNKKLDYIKFQVNELTKANLSVEEEATLKKELDLLNNQEQIMSLITNIKSSLSSIGDLYDASSDLEKLAKYDSKYEEMAKIALDSYYQLEDLQTTINRTNYDFNDLSQTDYINERLMTYSDLKRKYKTDTLGLINILEELKSQIFDIDNYEDILKQLENEKNRLYDDLISTAKKLREVRISRSIELQKDIVSNLHDLELKNTLFEIRFNDLNDNIKLYENGIDEVSFMVSFNKGESLNPLQKVASGGELSRFMLALKTILSKSLVNQTIIFDEIDSGVSGHVAYSIAQKISSIANYAQVLCITHLPQVAAISNHHLRLSKEIINDRTSTSISELSYDERVYEIANMISNAKVNETSLSMAKELLNK